MQSMLDKSGRRPFTLQYNVNRRIQPEPLLDAFKRGAAEDNEICLELSFKKSEPTEPGCRQYR
jgi:hypothetical protein